MSEISAYNDKIYIRDLSIRCIIGVNQDERTVHPGPFAFDGWPDPNGRSRSAGC